MPVQIRRATERDVDALERFERAAFVSYYSRHRFSKREFAYYVKSGVTDTYVAIKHGRVLGYVLGSQRRGSHRHVGRLLSIAVASTDRAQGIGTRLLRRFLRAARERGCRRVYLEVALPNVTAINLFVANGFKRVRQLPRYYTSRVHALRMRVVL